VKCRDGIMRGVTWSAVAAKGWATRQRFADQQIDVLGHDHVTSQTEAIAVANLTENFDEEVSRGGGLQQGESPVTAER